MSEIQIPDAIKVAMDRGTWGERAFGRDVLRKYGSALVRAELQRIMDAAFPDGEDSDWHYGCEELWSQVDRRLKAPGEAA